MQRKILLTIYALIDLSVIPIIGVLIYKLAEQYNISLLDGIVFPGMMLQFLIFSINIYVLSLYFPKNTKKIGKLFVNKILLFIFLFVFTSDYKVALLFYALSEVIALNFGYGLLLLIYRAKDNNALTYYFPQFKNKEINIKTKIKLYLKSPEIYPTIILVIPMMLFASYLGFKGIDFYSGTSTIPTIVIMLIWPLSLIAPIRDRYKQLRKLFADFYNTLFPDDFKKKEAK